MEERIKILIADDEEIVRDSLTNWLLEDGYLVEAVENGAQALEKIKVKPYNLLLVDLKMPGMDGIQVMEEVKKSHPLLPVIIITAYATVDTAVKAMKNGAYDYLVKPFNPEDLSLTIRRLVEHERLMRENILLRKELKKQFTLHDMVSKSHKMQEIFELVRTVAPSNTTVLIQGDSGTGKELLARAIHAESERSEGPFVSVSCAALVETLLESELFGYEKGAFTGAASQKKGKLELAEGGTLFLDEIGDISPKLQQDLLRVLEQKEFRRIGGNEVIALDVRVIAATNRDLPAQIKEGRFREDLYYRLAVISILLPPLRDRKEDIPLLVESFIERFNLEMGKKVEGVKKEVLDLLLGHNWPGNARELRNVIERAMVVTKANLLLEGDISLPAPSEGAGDASQKSLPEMEKSHILQVLTENNWHITRSAQVLGIDRVTLYNKIKKYDLKKP